MALPLPTQESGEIQREGMDTSREGLLNTDARQFLAALHQTFDAERRRLLEERRHRQERYDAGESPGFLPETALVTPIPNQFRPTNRTGEFRLAIDVPPHGRTRSFTFTEWYITKGDSDIDRAKR